MTEQNVTTGTNVWENLQKSCWAVNAAAGRLTGGAVVYMMGT